MIFNSEHNIDLDTHIEGAWGEPQFISASSGGTFALDEAAYVKLPIIDSSILLSITVYMKNAPNVYSDAICDIYSDSDGMPDSPLGTIGIITYELSDEWTAMTVELNKFNLDLSIQRWIKITPGNRLLRFRGDGYTTLNAGLDTHIYKLDIVVGYANIGTTHDIDIYLENAPFGGSLEISHRDTDLLYSNDNEYFYNDIDFCFYSKYTSSYHDIDAIINIVNYQEVFVVTGNFRVAITHPDSTREELSGVLGGSLIDNIQILRALSTAGYNPLGQKDIVAHVAGWEDGSDHEVIVDEVPDDLVIGTWITFDNYGGAYKIINIIDNVLYLSELTHSDINIMVNII